MQQAMRNMRQQNNGQNNAQQPQQPQQPQNNNNQQQPQGNNEQSGQNQQNQQPQQPANPFAAFFQAQQAQQGQQGQGQQGGNPNLGGNPFMNLGAFAPPQPQNNVQPEILYATQLGQLNAMGFNDAPSNIQALTMTGGNVQAAIDRLLNGNNN